MTLTNPAGAVMLLGTHLGWLGIFIAAASMHMPEPMPVDKTIIAKGVKITRGGMK
jgi:hypothetical protein